MLILSIFQCAMLAIPAGSVSGQTDADAAFSPVAFESEDGLTITADLYRKFDDRSKPLIVLCHQAGWSRGEYREIAPKLNELGFNCLAIDQRSGGAVNNVPNETAKRAKSTGKGTDYMDAEQDMIAALKYARKNYATGKLLIWGSSYSAALAIRIAGENPGLVDGSLSFAPGEYFVKAGKPADWITSSARKITKPMFVTSAKNEVKNWKSIFDAVDSDDKVMFVPATTGNHGSRALWEQFDDSDEYWTATRAFLKQFVPAG